MPVEKMIHGLEKLPHIQIMVKQPPFATVSSKNNRRTNNNIVSCYLPIGYGSIAKNPGTFSYICRNPACHPAQYQNLDYDQVFNRFAANQSLTSTLEEQLAAKFPGITRTPAFRWHQLLYTSPLLLWLAWLIARRRRNHLKCADDATHSESMLKSGDVAK
jgi:hypothetical protein